MSHFCIAVIYKDENDIEDLLAPYNESDEEYFKRIPVNNYTLSKEKEYYEKEDIKTKMSFKEFMEECGYKYDENTGKYCSWHNPNAVYDYYGIGNRDDEVRWKKDCSNKIKDLIIDNEEDSRKIIKDAYEFWEKFVDGDGEGLMFYNKDYYLQRYINKETYAEEQTYKYTPYYFITPDGELHKSGDMGWFAISNETHESWSEYYKDWLEALDKYADYNITFCDAHI